MQTPPRVCLRPNLREVLGNQRSEFEHPPADRLIADIQSTLRQEILNIPVAQSEPEIELDGMPNDVRWKSMASIGNGLYGPS
jgi:hypothetical protein